MTEKTTSQLRTELKALDALRGSRGWAVLRETMEAEIRTATQHLANKPTMPEAEMRYRVGAIWAAEKLLALPEQLITRHEAHLMLTEPDDPASKTRDNAQT